jgi:TPR repeat protein
LASPPVAAADIRPTVPPPAEQKTPPPTSTSQAAAALPPSVISFLLQNGNERLLLGDILSARLYFERAGAAGSEEGEMGAAKTYDPGYLATVDAPGLQPDVKRAIDWYRIAATTHGNREAQTRIDALTATGAK